MFVFSIFLGLYFFNTIQAVILPIINNNIIIIFDVKLFNYILISNCGLESQIVEYYYVYR